MSDMLPQRSINALRKQNDISVDLYGIDCDLYIPNNLSDMDAYDVYDDHADYEYDHYITKVWVEWSPNMYRLRAMGLYSEGDLPVLARFGKQAIADNDTIVNVDILVKSYIIVDPQYVPDNFEGYDEFEIVDLVGGNMHDAVIAKQYKLAPRRIKQ